MAGPTRDQNLQLEYKLVSAEEVPFTYAIEIKEYPESEAASLKNLVFRQQAAPDLFLGCYHRPILCNEGENNNNNNSGTSSLVGYIVSTLVSGDHLTHASMSSHDPSGDVVCIHSVCVSKAFQRRGVATRMMREYLQHLQRLNKEKGANYKKVLLIAHEHVVPLYARVGFVLIGESPITHGPDPWFEMVYALDQ